MGFEHVFDCFLYFVVLLYVWCKQNDKNQAVPQRFITRGTSGENISTITSTSSSNKQIVVSPRLTYTHTPRKHEDKGATNIIEETTTKKQKTKDDDSDHEICSKYHSEDHVMIVLSDSRFLSW